MSNLIKHKTMVEETKDVNDKVDPTIKELFENNEQNTVLIERADRLGNKKNPKHVLAPLK